MKPMPFHIFDKVNGTEQMDWTTLIGVLDNAVYGSRVDNEFDLRLVREYLNVFFR